MTEINLRRIDDLPDAAALRLSDVLQLIPVSKSTWWEGVKTGRYPKPLNLGARARGWRLGDIRKLTESSWETTQ